MVTLSSVLFVLLSIISYTRGQLIDCNGNCACPSTAPTPGAVCTLDCGGAADQCKEKTLTCRAGDPCEIRCTSKATCSSGTIINAYTATHVNIICGAADACTDTIDIYCGTGNCKLQCLGWKACQDFGRIDISQSKSFQCTGYCNHNGIPNDSSANPTTAPNTPTSNPTHAPTNSTQSATNLTSSAPTTVPTYNPTITYSSETLKITNYTTAIDITDVNSAELERIDVSVEKNSINDRNKNSNSVFIMNDKLMFYAAIGGIGSVSIFCCVLVLGLSFKLREQKEQLVSNEIRNKINEQKQKQVSIDECNKNTLGIYDKSMESMENIAVNAVNDSDIVKELNETALSDEIELSDDEGKLQRIMDEVVNEGITTNIGEDSTEAMYDNHFDINIITPKGTIGGPDEKMYDNPNYENMNLQIVEEEIQTIC